MAEAHKIKLTLSPQAERYARRDAPVEARRLAAGGTLPLPPVELATVPFVLAHFGAYSGTRPGIWFDEALELGARHRNVWYDLSAVPYVVTERRMIERARATVGTDRILFGSDYLDYMGFTLEAVRGTPYLTPEEKRGILGGNARRLLRQVDP